MIIYQRKAVAYSISEHLERVSIIPVHAIVGPEPHKSVVVLQNAGNEIIRQPILNAQTPDGHMVIGKQ